MSLTLDAGAETTLSNELLLTATGTLKVQKVFSCDKAKAPFEVFILAQHPTAPEVATLLELKEKELQAIVKRKG